MANAWVNSGQCAILVEFHKAMETLVVFTEEPSACNFLEVVHERLALPYKLICHPFNGKSLLKGRVHNHLRRSNVQDAYYIIMCDRDGGECLKLKKELLEACNNTGKEGVCKVRIACGELESFFLGDLKAVGRAYNMPNIAKNQAKSGYRSPDDSCPNPSERLMGLTRRMYQKTKGAKLIAEQLELEHYEQNRSASFRCLIRTLLELKKLFEDSHTNPA